MPNEEMERICFNCNNFFPASITEATEFCICLNDEEFSPFIDELLERGDYSRCQNLVDPKKFTGDREACADFSPVEELGEIEDSDEFISRLKSCFHNVRVDIEELQVLLIEEQIKKIDFSTLPVERHVSQLYSGGRPEEVNSAISSLGGLVSHGNEAAFNALFDFLKQLPSPRTIEEVHFRLEILRNMKYSKFKKSLTPFLLDELYRTPSNNTTRQWISAIFEHLKSLSFEEIDEPLCNMLHDKRFSYRLKAKMKEILSYAEWKYYREE